MHACVCLRARMRARARELTFGDRMPAHARHTGRCTSLQAVACLFAACASGSGMVQLGVPTAQERSHVLQSLLAPTRPTLELMHRRQDCCCQRTWQGEEAPLQRKCYGPDRLASRGVCSKNARRGRSAKSKNGSSCWRRSAEEKWRRAFLSRRR